LFVPPRIRRTGVHGERRLLINGIAVFAPERTFQGRGDIFYLEVTKGITEASAPHNVWVSCCGLEEQHADVKLFMEKASHKNINAIIIIGTDDSTIFKLASTLNKPCVLINSVDGIGSWMPCHPITGRLGLPPCSIFLSRDIGVCSRSPACGEKRFTRVWMALKRRTAIFTWALIPSVICS
jgi:hypothetical protein